MADKITKATTSAAVSWTVCDVGIGRVPAMQELLREVAHDLLQ